MKIDLLKTLRDGFRADIQKYKAENAKLRSERDQWHVEQVHAYGNWEDVHKYAVKVRAENEKLKALVRYMWDVALHPELFGDGSHLLRRMRELGIEVDE